jgi:cytoskeleton protein RodZ
MERIGDILRRERERRGDDLQQIADYLCIRRSFLSALEGSRYNEFPADAYVIGFLRSYAEYMGMNGKEAIDYYRYEMAGRRHKPSLAMPTPISEGRAPNAIILIGATLAAIMVYAIWYGLSSSDRASLVVPTPPPASSDMVISHTSETTPAPVAQTAMPAVPQSAPSNATNLLPATTAPTSIALPGPAPAQVMNMPSQTAGAQKAAETPVAASPIANFPQVLIRADQASWVLINDSQGHTVFDRVMKAGETYKTPDLSGLTLTTGNGSGITLTVNGAVMPRLTTSPAHVLRNIPLSVEGLRNAKSTSAE